MKHKRYAPASVMYEGDDQSWLVTQGQDTKTAEIFHVSNNTFTYWHDGPKEVFYHNLININHTRMALLGGTLPQNELYIIDRLIVFNNFEFI